MLLHEIKFNLKAHVNWEVLDKKYLGVFEFDGDTYQIDINLLELQLVSRTVSMADIAFRKNGQSAITNDNSPFKIFGPIINALDNKLSTINPDIVLFGVLHKDGSMEKRKSLYDKMSFLMSKKTAYGQTGKWIDIGVGEYTYCVKSSAGISKHDIAELEKFIHGIKDKIQMNN